MVAKVLCNLRHHTGTIPKRTILLSKNIVLCIQKIQSDLLNKKFLLRIDCKSAKDVLQKDVKNLA